MFVTTVVTAVNEDCYPWRGSAIDNCDRDGVLNWICEIGRPGPIAPAFVFFGIARGPSAPGARAPPRFFHGKSLGPRASRPPLFFRRKKRAGRPRSQHATTGPSTVGPGRGTAGPGYGAWQTDSAALYW